MDDIPEDEVPKRTKRRIQGGQFKIYMLYIYIIELPFNTIWQHILILSVYIGFTIQLYVISLFTSFRGYFLTRLILDVVYGTDIVLSLIYLFAYKIIKSVYRPKKVVYIVLDILTLFSFDYCLDFGDRPRIHPVFILMQLLLFVRFYRFFLYADPRNRGLHNPSSLELLIRLSSMTFLILHVITCLWLYICGFVHAPWTRGLIEKDVVIRMPSDRYVVASYAISIFFCGTGYGDLVAITVTERIIVMIAMAMGIFWIGIAVAALTSYHNDTSQHHFEYATHLRLIHQDLKDNVPHIVRNKILEYYGNLWIYKGGIVASDLFDKMPRSLRVAAHIDQYWEALQKSTILRGLDLPSKRALASRMKSELYVKGEVIIGQGQLRTKMMYIVRGIIKVLSSEDTESTVMQLCEGTLLGEMSIMLSTPSPVQLEAGSLCEIQVLDRDDLYKTAIMYRQMTDIICTSFIELWREALAHEKATNREMSIAKALGIPIEPPSNIKDILEEKEIELPYTWLHDDEMVHFISRPQVEHKSLGVYVPLKVTVRTSDGICARTKFPFVLQPGTSLLFAWDSVVVVFAIVAAIIYPTRAAMAETENRIIMLVISVVYVADFFISIMTAAEIEGETLVNFSDIVSYKLTHTRPLLSVISDVLSFIPFAQFYKGQSTVLSPLLELNHVLKIWKVHRFVKIVETKRMVNLALIRSVACLIWITILSYWMGSFYYLQACFGGTCRDASWYTNELVKDIEERQAIVRHSIKDQVMLYLGVGFVGSAGINDIHPSTITEMIFVLIMSIFSLFISSYFVGSYNAILKLVKASEMAFYELVFVVEQFLEYNEVSVSLQERVFRYLKLHWQYREGFYILNKKSLYYDTPPHLESEVLTARRREELLSVPLLENTEVKLLNYIARYAESYVLPPQEIVVYSGEPCQEFYVVEEGYCEKYSGISGELECVMGPKKYFCVMEMLFNIATTSEVRTLTHVKLLRVTGVILHNALCHSPITLHEIQDLVKEFQDNDELTCLNPRERKYDGERPQGKIKPSWVLFSRKHEDYLKPFLSDWTKIFRFILLPRTLVPNGTVLKAWESIRITLILISMIFFPTYSYIWLESNKFSYLRYLLDFSCLVDMYILMHVCYYSKEGVLVSHPKATLKNYLTHNFPIDLIVLFPMDIFTDVVESEVKEGYYSLQYLANFSYIHKLLAFYRIRSIREFSEVGEDQTSKKWFQDVLFFFCCIIMLNALTSILVITSISIIFNKDGTDYIVRFPTSCWINTKPFDHQSIYAIHLIGLYWTTCMTFCVALGDISPLNSNDMMYCVVTFLVGYVLVTYMMVRITSRISGFGVYFTTYKNNLKQMVEFLKKKRVSSKLQSDIVEHFIHVWSVSHSVDAQSILSKFHFALQQDTACFLYEPTLRKCAAFHSVDYFFLRQLSVFVREEYVKERSIIFQVNDIVDDIFFIHRGKVTLTESGDLSQVILRKGCAFGNIDNCLNIRVTCTATAQSHVVLLRLKNNKLYTLLEDYYDTEQEIKESALKNKIYLTNVLGHEHDDIEQHERIEDSYAEEVIPVSGKGECLRKFVELIKKIHAISNDFLVLYSTASVIIISYQAAFQDHSLTVYIIEGVLTFGFFMNFNFRIFFSNPSKKVIKTLSERLKLHLKTKQFWLDIFCFLPINLLCFLAQEGQRGEIWSYLNFTYTFRVYYIIIYFTRKSKYQKLNEKMIKFNLMQMFITPTVLLHLTACVMYAVDCFKNQCRPTKWAYEPTSYDELPNLICQNKYICSLYWAIEVYSCTGVGDIVPESVADVFLMLVMIIISKFVVCTLVGNVAAMVAEHVLSESSYKYEMPILRKYLKCCQLSEPQSKHIESYAESLWRSQYGKQIPTFFKELPTYLRTSLMNEMYGYHITNNIVFAGSHPDFLRQLVTYLECEKYFAGNIIVRGGSIDGTMYFIDEGEVEVLTVSGLKTELKDILKAGDMFGMIQGLYKSTPHTRTFRATASTVILSLKYDEWRCLLSFFPETYRELYDRAYRFYFLP